MDKRALLLNPPANLLGFGFGSGLVPFAPGTFGTLAAIPIYLLISGVSSLVYGVLTLIGLIFGVRICEIAVASLARNSNKAVHDHPSIVWDEIIGFLITMIFVPLSPLTLCLGFVLFRFFDILKPWPIRVVDRNVHGGLGIMMDDVIAGVFANLSLQLLLLSPFL